MYMLLKRNEFIRTPTRKRGLGNMEMVSLKRKIRTTTNLENTSLEVTLMNREHLKKDKSKKEVPEKDNYGKEKT